MAERCEIYARINQSRTSTWQSACSNRAATRCTASNQASSAFFHVLTGFPNQAMPQERNREQAAIPSAAQ